MLELVEREVERGFGFRRGGMGLHEVALQVQGDLAQLRVGDTRVLRLREVDFDPTGVVREPRDARHLLLRGRLQPRGDPTVLASDLDVHRYLTVEPGVRDRRSRTGVYG